MEEAFIFLPINSTTLLTHGTFSWYVSHKYNKKNNSSDLDSWLQILKQTVSSKVVM